MNSPNDPLLTLDEAGELLGTGPGLPWRLVVEGWLDHSYDGRDVRVPQSALLAYLTVSNDAPSRRSVTAPADTTN